MKSTERKSQRDYTLAFKLSVVDQVEKGEMTYNQAQARYGIQGWSTVLVWLRKHGTQDWHHMGLRKNFHLAMTPGLSDRREFFIPSFLKFNQCQLGLLDCCRRVDGTEICGDLFALFPIDEVQTVPGHVNDAQLHHRV